MRSRTSDRRSKGFTLVELLVVIGIISILISILLPVLGSVRRQGLKAKCAAQMRDMGMAMLMYAQENKGYLPPVRISTSYTIDKLTYAKGGAEVLDVSIKENAKWWHFVAHYVSKIKPMPQTDAEMGSFMKSTFWCPAFPGFPDNSGVAVNFVGGTNRNLPGIGMNWWPSFKADYPLANLDANGLPKAPAELFADCTSAAAIAGTWYKLVQFTRPAERALLADSRQFYLEARMVAAGATIPGQRLMFANNDYSNGTVGASQTMFDFYRHGVNPPVADNTQATGYFSPTGGKIGYNILYADGHVSSPTDREEGYRACRMRFPN